MPKIVERILDLLELFAVEKRPLRLTAIAQALRIPASSCHDTLQALVGGGFLYELGPRKGYYPTVRLQEISRSFIDADPIRECAASPLQNLSEALGGSIFLAKAGRLQATYLLVAESPYSPSSANNSKPGTQLRGLTTTSAGKAILAQLPDIRLEEYLRTARLTALTPKSIVSKDKLVSELNDGKKRGWFTNVEESVLGRMAISTSFSWHHATYIATITAPVSQLSGQAQESVERLLETARVLQRS